MFKQYRYIDRIECRPYEEGESLEGVTVGGLDRQMGSPKAGDVVARLPDNPDYRWLITAEHLAEHYEPVDVDREERSE